MVDFEANVQKILDDKSISPENRQYTQKYTDEAEFEELKNRTMNNIMVTMRAFNRFTNNKDFNTFATKHT